MDTLDPQNKDNPSKTHHPNEYAAPQISYEGDISTRAGSALSPDAPDPADPSIDLFGD